MGKTKAPSTEVDGGKVSKKPTANVKDPPPAITADALATPTSMERSALRNSLITPPRISSPSARPTLDLNNNAGDDGIDGGDDDGEDNVDLLLAEIGLKPVPAPTSVNMSDMNSNTTKGGPTDSILRMAALTLWNNLWLLLFRFDPIHETKNYPDYKMYKMHDEYKQDYFSCQGDKKKMKKEFRWMASCGIHTSYFLWHVNNEPVLASQSQYTTRLYGCICEGTVKHDQAMFLARLICDRLNAYRPPNERMKPKTGRRDAAAIIANEVDPSSLFWVPLDTPMACTDIMSEDNAWDLFTKHCRDWGLTFDNTFFNRHRELCLRYFGPGSLSSQNAATIGAISELGPAPAHHESKTAASSENFSFNPGDPLSR